MLAATVLALAVSVQRRSAGVRGREEVRAARRGPCLGDDRPRRRGATLSAGPSSRRYSISSRRSLGAIGLLAAAQFAGGPYLLAAARLLVGAVFLGSVSDAMLLGHWYLVQPGLPRGPLKELVAWTAAAWPFEIAVFLWPTAWCRC